MSIGFAVNDDLSVSYTREESERNLANSGTVQYDIEMDSIQVAYSLGGATLSIARADYDKNNDNGEILEENENNNDARYSELLRVKPDLQITAMRVDSKYAGDNSGTPNVDDTVTFTVTVTNAGAADVDNSRLYITADSSTDNAVSYTHLTLPTNREV